MADGDFDVKTRFRSALPGVGYNSSGAAVNDKTMVVGSITFTYNTNGLSITGPDLGLSTIDFMDFSQVAANNDTAGTAGAPLYAIYDGSKVIITDDAGTEATDSQTGSMRFIAFGDSAAVANLT